MATHYDVFTRRLHEEWLPTFCSDPARNYLIEGYKPSSNYVTEEDARDFVRAMDIEGLITDLGGGSYKAPRSKAKEYLFWEGLKATQPRPITLWMEPVITVAAVGRLHLDFGWPVENIGMQSRDWAFDFTAFLSADDESEYVAGEVKKTVGELTTLILDIQACCDTDSADAVADRRNPKNASNKWLGLKRSRARYFWAVGPGNVSRLFDVSHSASGAVSLAEVDIAEVAFPVTLHIDRDEAA